MIEILPSRIVINRPSNLETNNDFEEYISNYLSDKYDFCVNSFCYEFNDKKIYISNIDWDEEE